MGDVVWMLMDNYRGRIAFPEYLSINYNVFFTSWHILFVLGFDSDVPDNIANTTADLYLVGPGRKLFNKKVFTGWILCAVYHGVSAWMAAAYLIIGDGSLDELAEYDAKKPGRFWEGSITAFTTIILVVCLKLLLHCQSPFSWKTSILPTLGAIGCYLGIFWCLAYVPPGPSLQPSMAGIPVDLMKNMTALIAMVAAPCGIITLDVILAVTRYMIWPTPLEKVRAKIRDGTLHADKGPKRVYGHDDDHEFF